MNQQPQILSQRPFQSQSKSPINRIQPNNAYPQQMYSPIQYQQLPLQQQLINQQMQQQHQLTQTHHMTTTHSHIHKYKRPDQLHKQEVMHEQNIQHHQQTHHSHIHKYQLPYQPPVAREIQPQKQIVNPKQPEISEFYHVERELQMISAEEVEEPWRKKCVELEIIIYDLQTELARYKNLNLGEKADKVDDFQIKELELKINQMKESESRLRSEVNEANQQTDLWRNRYQSLQLEFQQKIGGGEEVRQLREQLSNKDREIFKLENTVNKLNEELQSLYKQIKQQSDEINYLNNHIKELEYRLETTVHVEEQITFLSNEIDVWKQKFKNANKDFHDAQEKWMMAQAELDSIKNKQTIVTTEKQTIVNQMRGSRTGTINHSSYNNNNNRSQY